MMNATNAMTKTGAGTGQDVDRSEVEPIVAAFQGRQGAIIPLLQEIQRRFGYVPKTAVDVISEKMGVYPVELYGILTFYAQFYLEPRGKHTIKLCQGTACYIMGGKLLLDQLEGDLQVHDGETTEDGQFTLETVACLGCCGMAPVMMVDSDFYGSVKTNILNSILERYREQDKQ